MAEGIEYGTYEDLIAEAVEAFRQDFRYAESVAKQGATMLQRREAREQKTA